MLTVDTILQQRYRIIRQLGQGGMGAVYEAVDERLGKIVAIKEILLEIDNIHNEAQRDLTKKAFKREANSLVQAKHIAVPDVTDYFSELERQFLVMEYIEGDDLAKMLSIRKKPFSVEDVLPWVNQLLEALDYLHNLEPAVIHRDIKPQNLKINKWHRIKLLDFGIAKNTDKNSTLTRHAFLGATLNYSPMEQVIRVIDPTFREFMLLKHREKVEIILNQDTDLRCDIFALGATFYHLLTNETPVDVTKRTLEIWENRNDPLLIPHEINPEIPEPLSIWLMKAMSFERDNRFESAKNMQIALADAIFTDTTVTEKNIQINTGDLKVERENTTTQNQFNTQAKTERLIEADFLPYKTEDKVSPETLQPLIEPTNINYSETVMSEELASANYKSSDIDISDSAVSDKLTDLSYTDNLNEEAEKSSEDIEFSPFINKTSEKSSNNNRLYFLAIPVIGIISLIVFGGGLYGVVTLMTSSETPVQSNSSFENSNVNAVNSSETTISEESDLNTNQGTSANVVDTNQLNTDESSTQVSPATQPNVPSTSKPVIKNTPKPAAKPKPVITKTPIPVSAPKQTPVPKPTKDPRCIYTNSC